MNVTAESSVEHAQALAYLPPATQCWLYSRDDERLCLQAELAQCKAALAKQRTAQADNALIAGATRSTTKRTAVLAMANDHLPQLRVLHSQRGRALFILRQLQVVIELNNGSWHNLTRPPHWRTIAWYIKDLQLNHK